MEKYITAGLLFFILLSCSDNSSKDEGFYQDGDQTSVEQLDQDALTNQPDQQIAQDEILQDSVEQQDTDMIAADETQPENDEQVDENQDQAVDQEQPESREASMGMGLAGIADWSTQYPFIDFMKQARAWKDWDNKIEGFDLDEHDWVKSLKADQTAGTVFLVVGDETPVVYDRLIVMYEGKGKIEYGWSAKKIDDESESGRDVIQVGKGNHLLKIVDTDPEDYIRNIRIIPERLMTAYEEGEVFNPEWIERIRKFRAYRFMDWMDTNNSEQSSWENRPHPDDRTYRRGGVPLEIMIRLCNETNSDAWFNIPHLADNNYIAHFAQMVKDKLNPNLLAYVEHSNEVWNWMFSQAQYANTEGRARWGDHGNAYMQWHGMKTAEICDIFKKDVFKEEAGRVKCVLGVQTAYHGLQKGALECPLWAEEGHEPCYKHGFDYIGITTYFNGGLNGPRKLEGNEAYVQKLRDMIAEPDGGMQKAIEQLSDGRHLRDVEKYAEYQGVEQETVDTLAYWKEQADNYGLKLAAYEGGQHITANGHALQDDEDIINFHISINRHEIMYGLYTGMLNAWKEHGGELHMHFVDVGRPSKYGSWGALEYVTQEGSPRFDALSYFNQSVPCWWDGCTD